MNRLDRLLLIVCSAFLLLPPSIAWSCDDTGVSLELQDLPNEAPFCNDGTAAQYYLKYSGSPLTLIYLGGGGQCSDQGSCDKRYNGQAYPYHDCSNSTSSSVCFMSSKDNPKTCSKGGIFDSLSSRANLVYVPYCSSDGWMGDKSFGGYEFRGASIALAVVDEIISKTNTKKLIFGGGSAGGRGSSVLLDAVANRMVSLGIEVLGFHDSPYYVADEPISSFEGFESQTQDVYTNFLLGSDLERTVLGLCSDAYPTEKWKCLFGEYRFPFLMTDHLLMTDQFDGWQLSHDIHGYDGIEAAPVYTDSELDSVIKIGKETHALLKTLPNAWSTSCYAHHISEGDGFFKVRNNLGLSQEDALALLIDGDRVGGEGWIDEVPETFSCCCETRIN